MAIKYDYSSKLETNVVMFMTSQAKIFPDLQNQNLSKPNTRRKAYNAEPGDCMGTIDTN